MVKGNCSLSDLVVKCEPWITFVLKDPVFFCFFLLPNYLHVPISMATVSKSLDKCS